MAVKIFLRGNECMKCMNEKPPVIPVILLVPGRVGRLVIVLHSEGDGRCLCVVDSRQNDGGSAGNHRNRRRVFPAAQVSFEECVDRILNAAVGPGSKIQVARISFALFKQIL